MKFRGVRTTFEQWVAERRQMYPEPTLGFPSGTDLIRQDRDSRCARVKRPTLCCRATGHLLGAPYLLDHEIASVAQKKAHLATLP